jgi:hypothetical protein
MKYFRVCFFTLLGYATLFVTSCAPDCYSECSCPSAPIKPPLGLKAIPGDRSVTLTFDSANSREDGAEFFGFAAYMAEGEYLSDPAPKNYYDFPEIEAFDSYGDEVVCGGDFCEGDSNGLMPAMFVGSGFEAIKTELGIDLPGRIFWEIEDGDPNEFYSHLDYRYPCNVTNETNETVTENNFMDCPIVFLENNVTYTVFVTVRADEGSNESYTSNWVSFTPTATTEPVE